jgi:hypothetical protein
MTKVGQDIGQLYARMFILHVGPPFKALLLGFPGFSRCATGPGVVDDQAAAVMDASPRGTPSLPNHRCIRPLQLLPNDAMWLQHDISPTQSRPNHPNQGPRLPQMIPGPRTLQALADTVCFEPRLICALSHGRSVL